MESWAFMWPHFILPLLCIGAGLGILLASAAWMIAEKRGQKTVEDLRKDITALEASAKLVDTVADLQERNEELDNVLKAKCQEIEENDDRFIK